MTGDRDKSGSTDDAMLDSIRSTVARLSRAERGGARQKPLAPEINPEAAGLPREAAIALAPQDPEPDAYVPESDAFPAAREETDVDDALRRAEAVLFAASEPVAAGVLAEALPFGTDVANVLMRLKRAYEGRGVELVEVAGKWRFQTARDLGFLFEETREEEVTLSRAALETLSVIAYCQPVTRAEIEDVRGVAVSKGTIDLLMELKWVRMRGRRRTPGRPITYGVTDAFLEHFGLEGLDALPGRDEMRAAGLLSAAIPDDFDMPRPYGSEADEDLIDVPDREGDEIDFVTDYMSDDD